MATVDCFAAYTLWKKQKRIEQDRKQWDAEIVEVFDMAWYRYSIWLVEELTEAGGCGTPINSLLPAQPMSRPAIIVGGRHGFY